MAGATIGRNRAVAGEPAYREPYTAATTAATVVSIDGKPVGGNGAQHIKQTIDRQVKRRTTGSRRCGKTGGDSAIAATAGWIGGEIKSGATSAGLIATRTIAAVSSMPAAARARRRAKSIAGATEAGAV